MLNLYNIPTRAATDLREAEDNDLNRFGNDPVQITGSSISKEHLNIEFNFKGSGNNNIHDFTLILPEGTELDNRGMLLVELRHDAKSDTPTGWYWGVTSFTLKSIPEYQQTTFRAFSSNTTAVLTAKLYGKSKRAISSNLFYQQVARPVSIPLNSDWPFKLLHIVRHLTQVSSV